MSVLANAYQNAYQNAGTQYAQLYAQTTATGTTINSVVINGSQVYNIGLPQVYGNLTANYEVPDYGPSMDVLRIENGKIGMPKGRALRVEMADGSYIETDVQGNFKVQDKNAKVIYKANRVREFNPFVNASDLLAEFIAYVGTLGVKRSEVQTLPLGLFVNWLVIRAAETDDDPVPDDIVPVPAHKLLRGRVSPRCLLCQRYVKRIHASAGFAFCNPLCATKMHLRLVA